MNLGFLTKETAGLPNWAWGLVIVAGGGIGYYFVRKNQASSSSTAAANAQSQPSATGQSTSGAAGSYGSSIDYSSSLPISASNPSSPVYVLSGTQGTTPPSTPVTPTTQTITIRAPATSGPTAQYDASHSGIPVHAGPSWQTPTTGTLAWGSNAQVVPTPVNGGSNFPNGWQGGSTVWYQLTAGGFISSFDIAGIGGGAMVQGKQKALALPGH